MSMKITGQSSSSERDNYKLMNEMKSGEVCYVPEVGKYVVCVTHFTQKNIHLILDNHDQVNSWGHGC